MFCTYFRENGKNYGRIIKEEISTVEDTCTVYVTEEDIKEESTEDQGMGKDFLYIFF